MRAEYVSEKLTLLGFVSGSGMPAKRKKPAKKKRATPKRPRRDKTTSELAAHLGVANATVRQWVRVRKIRFSKLRGRLYFDFAEVDKQLADPTAVNIGGRGRPAAAPLPPDLKKIELRKQQAITEKHELQAARMRRELIPREDVDTCAAEVVASLLEGFRSIARSEPRDTREYAEDVAERGIESGLVRAKAAVEKLVGSGG